MDISTSFQVTTHPGSLMATGKTILVVEDDPSILALERFSLEQAGYSARVAATAEQALAELRRESIDLLVLDYRLPGTNGLDLYARARASGFDAPVILVTAFGEEDVIARAMQAGVSDFVSKTPDYLDRLSAAVDRQLARLDPPSGPADPRALSNWDMHLIQVWERSLDAMRLTDATGTILRVNEAYCRLLGKSRESLEGANFSLGYLESSRQRVLDRHAEQFASGKCESLALRRITLWDGREVHLEFSSSFLDVPGQPRVLLNIIRDISPRVALEDRLRQSQKMDAIGRLAGGVAHDFNNLLTAISGYSEMLHGALSDPSHRELAVEVIKAADRAANLTRQLLAFSRKQILSPDLLDINSVVQDMGNLLRRLIGEDIIFNSVLQDGLWLVKADPGCLEQVIVNLAINARDAMPTGGRLTLETRNVVLDAEYAQTRPDAQSGPHVLFAVSDTGCGMDAATLSRIFEPFFTTKGEKGTGLGLATVYGVVKQSGGHIGVYSEPGKGSNFKVYLPRAEGQPSSGMSATGLPLPSGSETILLVEDDDSIRTLTQRILEGCGYFVLCACDGGHALDVAERHAGVIDLLVTDVVMPRLGGGQLAERLSKKRPGMKVLYLSGYTDDAVVRHGVLERSAAFLHKPFTIVALAGKVRETLQGQG